MGCEFLQTGQLTVFRPDAGELIAIKSGAWSLDEVRAEAARQFERLNGAMDGSPLPDRPDFAAINALVTRLVSGAVLGRA